MSFLPTFFNKSAQLQHYKLLTHLTTYSGSVYALAISNDGNLLACGGTEGIKIWDIKSRKELTSSSHHHESRGTVSCAIWSTTRKTAAETLCYGTGLGYIIFLRHSLTNKKFQEICTRRLGSGFEITCLSWHSTSSEGNLWIAVGMRDKIVQVLTLNASSQLQSVFAVRLENTVPKSVVFADNRDVYVFGLYDGNFIKLKDEDGSMVQEMSCKSVIGYTAVHSKWGVFIMDNVADGFTLYRLEGDDSFLDSAVNRVHGYMTSATIVNVANEFSQHVKAAMKFGEYVDIKDDNEGLTEGSIKHDIRMLWGLAAKLMEIVQEAGGEANEDEGKHDTDHPQAAKGDEWTKSLTIVQ
ncbi:hypothetical protein BDR06DRAFT_1008660 [Suillus hirtellus]|nr:hypothetical protein BDR06DRAFT_1008660 [Suillus hirtellus]